MINIYLKNVEIVASKVLNLDGETITHIVVKENAAGLAFRAVLKPLTKWAQGIDDESKRPRHGFFGLGQRVRKITKIESPDDLLVEVEPVKVVATTVEEVIEPSGDPGPAPTFEAPVADDPCHLRSRP